MSKPTPEEKARLRAKGMVHQGLSDEKLFKLYIGTDEKVTPLQRRYNVQEARAMLLLRLSAPSRLQPRHRDDLWEAHEHEGALKVATNGWLNDANLFDLLELAQVFAAGEDYASQWCLIVELCKTLVLRRLLAATAERNSLEYSRAQAIEFILQREFQTDIQTLNHYIWEPINAHEWGVEALDNDEIKAIQARIFHGRMVVAACDLAEEAGYTKLKHIKPVDEGGRWSYGDALTWVRAFLGNALEFEYKLRRGVFTTFTADPDHIVGRIPYRNPPPTF
ncbi:hypothetical protein [Asticcacaulis sp. YBE204]|uniref:hypothetical protein n=1 Tax=Asticcacaulis sp. YBE204 TaxID=1282363 RepID=UPI0003C3D44A|nr:hypothetical protein [Asticcacaulis sp. YBE204]ESQ76557.1 hypothetical protein AEYBE204_19390 [Asticcacaulis sp. YBE204]